MPLYRKCIRWWPQLITRRWVWTCPCCFQVRIKGTLLAFELLRALHDDSDAAAAVYSPRGFNPGLPTAVPSAHNCLAVALLCFAFIAFPSETHTLSSSSSSSSSHFTGTSSCPVRVLRASECTGQLPVSHCECLRPVSALLYLPCTPSSSMLKSRRGSAGVECPGCGGRVPLVSGGVQSDSGT